MKSEILSPGAVGSGVTVTFCPSANIGMAAVGGAGGAGAVLGGGMAGAAGAEGATVGAGSGDGAGTGVAVAGE